MKKEQNNKIIIFQEDEKALNYRYKLENPLNNNVAVKSIDYDKDDFINEFKIVGDPPSVGTVYYLHPYQKDTYIHQDTDEHYYLREKLNLYRRFGSKLGAKSIQTTLKLTKSEKIEIESDGKVTFKVVKTDVNVKNQIESNYRNSLEIKEEYQQQENFDLFKNIDELKTIIKENNLGYETELIELIEGRDSRNSGTSLISREVKSEISSEYNKLLEISADVTAPTFSISTNFKNRFESVNTLSIEIKYEF